MKLKTQSYFSNTVKILAAFKVLYYYKFFEKYTSIKRGGDKNWGFFWNFWNQLWTQEIQGLWIKQFIWADSVVD